MVCTDIVKGTHLSMQTLDSVLDKTILEEQSLKSIAI